MAGYKNRKISINIPKYLFSWGIGKIFKGLKQRVRISHGKWVIGVWAIEVYCTVENVYSSQCLFKSLLYKRVLFPSIQHPFRFIWEIQVYSNPCLHWVLAHFTAPDRKNPVVSVSSKPPFIIGSALSQCTSIWLAGYSSNTGNTYEICQKCNVQSLNSVK